MISRLDRLLGTIHNAIESGSIKDLVTVSALEQDRAFLVNFVASADPGGLTLTELKDDGDLV